MKGVDLLIKTHIRRDLKHEISPETLSYIGEKTTNVFLCTDESVSLIKASDIIINTTSSIVLDALILGKPVVYPKHLSNAELIIEDFPLMLTARDTKSTVQIIESLLYENGSSKTSS